VRQTSPCPTVPGYRGGGADPLGGALNLGGLGGPGGLVPCGRLVPASSARRPGEPVRSRRARHPRRPRQPRWGLAVPAAMGPGRSPRRGTPPILCRASGQAQLGPDRAQALGAPGGLGEGGLGGPILSDRRTAPLAASEGRWATPTHWRVLEALRRSVRLSERIPISHPYVRFRAPREVGGRPARPRP